jgi:CRP/FNR family transcriptional regulator, anaerobic regulatory protein
MTNSVRQKAARQPVVQGASGSMGQSSALRAIEEIAAVVRLKRGDRLDLGKDRAKLVYAVRSGHLILQADLSKSRRVAMTFYSPGNVLRLCDLPQIKSLAAVATVPCQILRMGEMAFDRLCEQSADVRLYCMRETAEQSARDKAHIVLLAGLSGEERVASFFVEMAARMGRQHGLVVSVEIPFSRSDIANFLALNPDTLSRIFSRLKSLGLVRTSGRRSVEIMDLQRLAQICPPELARNETDGERTVLPFGKLMDEKTAS